MAVRTGPNPQRGPALPGRRTARESVLLDAIAATRGRPWFDIDGRISVRRRSDVPFEAGAQAFV